MAVARDHRLEDSLGSILNFSLAQIDPPSKEGREGRKKLWQLSLFEIWFIEINQNFVFYIKSTGFIKHMLKAKPSISHDPNIFFSGICFKSLIVDIVKGVG